MAILRRCSFLLLLIFISVFECIDSQAATDDRTRAKEIVECSMIRIAEQFHILENIDKREKIRAWIIKRIDHELYMMETVELTKDQQRFVREMREHLAKQKP
jgi:hypothetical protein